jgi:glyoxylate reductase
LTKPKIYVTRQLFKPAIDILEKHGTVEIFEGEDNPIPRALLLEKVLNADGLLSLLTDKIDREVFEIGKKLRVISNYAVGFNNIDVAEATKRGIWVTNTPGILTETTADCAFALIMASARRIPEGDRNIRAKKWVHAWGPKMFIGTDIHGKTLGIIGMGRIGKAMIKRAQGFNMNVIYNNPKRIPELEKEHNIFFETLDALLEKSDFVSIHTPLNDKTHHLIGKQQLVKMKKTAYLINTSRGPVVDEAALYEALKAKKIAGAGLDVFENEPIDPTNPLIKLDNIVLTPHIASASIETRTAMAVRAAKNLVAVLGGEEPLNQVNPEVKKR